MTHLKLAESPPTNQTLPLSLLGHKVETSRAWLSPEERAGVWHILLPSHATNRRCLGVVLSASAERSE